MPAAPGIKIAVFDLDLTLSTRHMWTQLGYHRRGSEDLRAMRLEQWVEDQGGPEDFQPERLRALFLKLKGDGFDLGLATYNKRHVADCFLEIFELRRYFEKQFIMSRDDGGPKSEHWSLIGKAAGTENLQDIQGIYYDDSLEECNELKRLYPHFKIHHVEYPLSSPLAGTREIEV